MSSNQNDEFQSENRSHVLDNYMKLKENFAKTMDGLGGNTSPNTVTSHLSRTKEQEPSIYNSNRLIDQHKEASLSTKQPGEGLLIQSQLEHSINGQRNDGTLSSSSKSSTQEGINKQLFAPNLENKGSFKKNLINNSIQRLQNSNTSFTSPTSLNGNISSNPQYIFKTPQDLNTHPSDNQSIDKPNNINNVNNMSNFFTKEDSLFEERQPEPVQNANFESHSFGNNADPKQSSSHNSHNDEIDQAGLEEATMEALKILSNRLYGSEIDHKSEFKSHEKENLVNDSPERPVCKNKEELTSASNKSGNQKQTKNLEVDISGEPSAFNYSGVKTPPKEDNSQTNAPEVQGFTGFVSPMSPGADDTQTIQLSNLYVLNNTMHQLLGIKYPEESFERPITADLLKSSNSHNISFSVDQPTAERVNKSRDFIPVVSNFEQNQPELFICSAENLRKQEVEPDFDSPVNAHKYQYQYQNFENVRPESEPEGYDMDSVQIEQLMTSRKCQSQLIEAIKKINVRTFLMLKNIIKPSENILFCCQAFTKLFAGLSDVIPSSFSIMNNIEWDNIKVMFNSPLKILNAVSSLPKLIEESQVPKKNINAALASLARICYDEEEDVQSDAFYQLYEFIVSAIEYYKYYKLEPAVSLEESPEKSLQVQRTQSAKSNKSQGPKKTDQNAKPKSAFKPGQRIGSVTTDISSGRQPSNRSVSPISAHPSSQKTVQSSASKENSQALRGLKTTPSKRAMMSKTPPPSRPSQTQKDPQQGQTHVKNLRNAFNDSRRGGPMLTEGFDQELDEGNVENRMNTHEVECEVSRLDDQIERNNKEAREYRAKASRLLVDHERYIKKLQRTKELIRDELERDHALQDRRDMANYLESKEALDNHYHREIIMEEFEMKKEIKDKEIRARKVEQNDEILENLKDHCFTTAQRERAKYEKKKQLWEQYKKISADKLAKRKKATEESIIQKREISNRKIDDYVWKKQQMTKGRDKYKGDYELLSKMIGDAI